MTIFFEAQWHFQYKSFPISKFCCAHNIKPLNDHKQNDHIPFNSIYVTTFMINKLSVKLWSQYSNCMGGINKIKKKKLHFSAISRGHLIPYRVHSIFAFPFTMVFVLWLHHLFERWSTRSSRLTIIMKFMM